jgi:hypothetical protein
LDSAFRDTVLVLSPDSRESHFLIGIQGILKVLCIKGLVIGMIMFNNDSVFRCETFKGILRHNCFARVHRHLTFRVNEPGSVIDKDGSTIVLFVTFLFTFSMW